MKVVVFGKLFMFIFALFLIAVLLTGGKAFADELSFVCYENVCVSGEYEPTPEEMEEMESEPLEEVEGEVEGVEDSTGMAEGASLGVPTPVQGIGPAFIQRTPRTHIRHARCSHRRTKGSHRSHKGCRSRKRGTSHTQKGH